MSLKDILLMEVPSNALKKIIKNKGLSENVKLNSADEMATALVSDDPKYSEKLANEFKYAGVTAVNLNIIMSSISPDWNNKDYFKKHLINKYTDSIFNVGIRPPLDKTPKLIQAYDHGDKLVLAFSFLGTSRRYLENFQIVSRSPQIVEYVVIHFSPFAVEVRAAHDQNKTFRDSIVNIMGLNPPDVIWDKATKLNETQANELAVKLGAKLRAAKHKMIVGPYATKEVTANTQVEDLESDEQYKQEFQNQPMKKKTLTFEFIYSFGYVDTISYQVTEDGLWIRSKAGEEVINYILEQIIKIRYPSENESEAENFDELIEDITIEDFEEDKHIS